MKRWNDSMYLIPQGAFNDITGKYDEGIQISKICNIYENTTQAIGFNGNEFTSNIQIEVPEFINVNEHCKVIFKKDLDEKTYFIKGVSVIDNYKGRKQSTILFL